MFGLNFDAAFKEEFIEIQEKYNCYTIKLSKGFDKIQNGVSFDVTFCNLDKTGVVNVVDFFWEASFLEKCFFEAGFKTIKWLDSSFLEPEQA